MEKETIPNSASIMLHQKPQRKESKTTLLAERLLMLEKRVSEMERMLIISNPFPKVVPMHPPISGSYLNPKIAPLLEQARQDLSLRLPNVNVRNK